MEIGDKIRNLRQLKGYSQENMANMLEMSLPAYGDIERNKKGVNLNRLEQIGKVLDISVSDILSFGDRISNFFENCQSVVAGINNGGQFFNNEKELKLKLEYFELENEKLKIEIELLKKIKPF